MCRFIESIKLLDGKFYRLPYHQHRINRAFEDLYPHSELINLAKIIADLTVPDKGLFKCRLVFDSTLQFTEIVPYKRRTIESLQLVEASMEAKSYKLEQRTSLNAAYEQRGRCDDILIVNQGYISDTWYANVALWDGKHWFTPTLPIIEGVQRASLLRENKIIAKDIAANEISNYTRICIFNAMMEFGEIELDTKQIFNVNHPKSS
ncbi:MAG: hypothetical protein AUK44_02570 [Porphyromonadaceae bacterium CG2_30_38_12]|nr:MAG: hypothetical protein AUK44_02570 [Porphyromonadaceae bacterium CG2_30_38_12]